MSKLVKRCNMQDVMWLLCGLSYVKERKNRTCIYLLKSPNFLLPLLTEIGPRLALAGGDVQAQALPAEDGDIALSAR